MTVEPTEINDPDLQRTANLFGAMCLGIADTVDKAMADAEEIHSTTATALIVIRQFPDITVRRLERFLRVSRPATIRIINSLEQQDLASRQQSTFDHRQSLVRLTDEGTATAKRLVELRRNVLLKILENMSTEQREVLDSAVDNVLTQLTNTLDEAHELCRQCEVSRCPQNQCPVEQRAVALGGGIETLHSSTPR